MQNTSPKRNVGANELVVHLYLSVINRPIALAPKIVGIEIDQTIVDTDTFMPHLVHRVGKS